MALKKTHLLISAFVVFWIFFIGWGMFKTTFQLTREKPPILDLDDKDAQQEIYPQQIKIDEAATGAPGIEAETPPILVRTFKVKPTEFRDVLPVMGTVKGKTEIELRFEINGVIKTIYFREGEKVKKGSLIACLDPLDAQLKLDYTKNKFSSTQAAYNASKKKLEVHRKLFEAGAIIKSKLEEMELESESAKFQLETVKCEMELAANELKKTSLYATKDGLMGPREAEEGEFTTPQDKIGSLLETSEVFIEVGIVERDINKIKLAQKARVYVDAYPDIAFEGVIDNIFPIVEGKSRTLTAKIKVANPDGLLFPGMFSRAEIFICQLKDALIIPTTSLIRASTGVTLVPVIPTQSIEKTEAGTEIGFLQLRRVDLGYLTNDYAQVTKGLNADDLVIIEAQGELKDNAKVKIIGVEELSF
ncbi:MAG: efflux RND transporter periplasmic adaptor subunit [Candidatus Omnitrophica bacterium]|nr:efflux RND transporter periplasmic adaptor subunit [Candidatus Omnitrophota bacterium]MBU4472992.1 efflux RND transporter periplasmic adaptor subunit [Candidatus Omnitrophota bacterium]MCG2706808.1 efflux RND transporter periplasmic adaptor subunit [Candidatus Omnitrophota bacterium]